VQQTTPTFEFPGPIDPASGRQENNAELQHFVCVCVCVCVCVKQTVPKSEVNRSARESLRKLNSVGVTLSIQRSALEIRASGFFSIKIARILIQQQVKHRKYALLESNSKKSFTYQAQIVFKKP
jgi:hypothetical protein